MRVKGMKLFCNCMPYISDENSGEKKFENYYEI
jgi:hypothetical protein